MPTTLLQVNLFQKPSFLHQLTHKMTRDCSLNSPKNTSSQHVVYKNCFFLFLFWHSKQYLYWSIQYCFNKDWALWRFAPYFMVFLFNSSDQMWYPILSRFWVARIFWHILTESGFDFDIPFSMTSRKKAEFLLSSLLSLVALPRSKHVHYTNAWSFCSPERNELNFGAFSNMYLCL